VPVAFTRWGSHGLAFVTYDQWVKPVPQPTGMLYVVNDAGFVSAQSKSVPGASVERVHSFPIPDIHAQGGSANPAGMVQP
jgi:hypothetical protein